MHVFKKKFLKPKTIAIIPPGGHNRREIQSNMALRWLMYISESQGVNIQHARSRGEKKIRGYKVDGYDQENNTVYEIKV